MRKSLFRKGTLLNPEGDKICRFKKGDKLHVLNGKHAKEEGALLSILTTKAKVIIEGVNLVKCYGRTKANQKGNKEPVIIEAPIHVSNVALICPKCLKPTKTRYEILEPANPEAKKRKVRICKRCNAQIDD
jgi:large subunit ribosomal protein L24